MNRIKHFAQVLFFGFMPILLMIGLSACDEPTRQERIEHTILTVGIPSGATNIERLNDQWYTFEWEDQCFLAMKYWRHAAVTKIDCED